MTSTASNSDTRDAPGETGESQTLLFLLLENTATLNHILSGCRVVLSQGTYKCHHDQVFEEIAEK